MIQANNPAVDAAALAERVREQAAAIREAGALTPEQERDIEVEIRLRAAVKRHLAVLKELAIAAERAKPRRELPVRLAKRMGPLAFAGRFLIAGYNYAFKAQRELDVALIGSIAQMVEMQQILFERALNNFSEERRLREEVRTLTRLVRGREPQPD